MRAPAPRYVGASKLADALAAAGNDGLRLSLLSRHNPAAKAALNGYIETARAGTSTGARAKEVVAVHAYAEGMDGRPLVDKNGAAYFRLVVGNRNDAAWGTMFPNTRRPGRKDPDFRIVLRLGRSRTIGGRLWMCDSGHGGAKFLSGVLGAATTLRCPVGP